MALVVAGAARADEEKPEKPEEPLKPYTEGWRGGSPPGERVAIRADLWLLQTQNTALELGHLDRMKALTTGDLGLARQGAAGGLGVELYTGKTGWLSIDWWATQSRGEAPLARSVSIDETSFSQGAPVESEVTQHIVKIRDGLDIRYRLPLLRGEKPSDDDTWLDFNFGPTWALLVRYESINLHDTSSGTRASDALLTVTLCPGLRAGVDLHVLDGFTVRVGSDIDLLPHLSHNWLSFTRAPSVDAWADARVFFAARFLFVEASVGWRYFRTLASGGHFRQAESDMRGAFAEIAARF